MGQVKNSRAIPILSFLVLLFQPSAAQWQRHRPSLREHSMPRRPSAQPPHTPTLSQSSAKSVGNGVKASGRRGSSSSSVISSSENCGGIGQRFELNLQISRDSCETSWVLERSITDETTYMVYVDGYDKNYVVDDFDSLSSSFSRNLCLREGKYRFTISDAYGDGIAAPGYYMLALDGVVLAGSSNFGYEEVTRFTVVNRQPISPMDESGEEFSSMGASDDFDIDDTFSTYVPERLSGVIDLSLVSAIQSDDEQEEDVVLEKGSYSTTSQAKWTEIFDDDFENGLGIFHASSIDTSVELVTFYPLVLERRGVIRLQNENRGDGNVLSSSIYSDIIAIPPAMTSIRLVFSYYANSNEPNDGFCLDYSIDNGDRLATKWRSKKCWHAMEDFENGNWYDDTNVVLHLRKDHDSKGDVKVKSFRIRFRCKTNSLHDDVLIDRVKLEGI